MCTCPVLIKFANKYHPKFMYGIGNSVPYTLTYKPNHGYIREETHFAPSPIDTTTFPTSAQLATYYNLPLYKQVPDYAAICALRCDNPLGLPSRYKGLGLYRPFLVEAPEETEFCMYVPCGKCNECVQRKMNDWTFKVQKDMSVTPNLKSYFLTLTYKPTDLPTDGVVSRYSKCSESFVHCSDGLLQYADFQLFMKRLRITLKRWYGVTDVHYFVCGEYGKTTARPHFHVVLWFSQTPEMLKNRNYQLKMNGGKTSFMVKLLRKLGYIPALTNPFFSRLAMACWSHCKLAAWDCQPVRNANATARYICKYIGKAKLFMSPNLRDMFNVYACPPLYHSSIRLAAKWAEKYAFDICNKDKPFESYTVKYDKDGHTLEYRQLIPSRMYEYAHNYIAKEFPERLDEIAVRPTFLAARIGRYAAMESVDELPDLKSRDAKCHHDLYCSNLQLEKYDNE